MFNLAEKKLSPFCHGHRTSVNVIMCNSLMMKLGTLRTHKTRNYFSAWTLRNLSASVEKKKFRKCRSDTSVKKKTKN